MKIDVNSAPLGICVFCEHEIFNTDKKFVLALERPIRINLWTHRACYNGSDPEGVKAFLQDHLQDYLDKYYNDQEITGNGKTKTEKIKRKKPINSDASDGSNGKRNTLKYRNSSPSKI